MCHPEQANAPASICGIYGRRSEGWPPLLFRAIYGFRFNETIVAQAL
jgi:hypothetical protein